MFNLSFIATQLYWKLKIWYLKKSNLFSFRLQTGFVSSDSCLSLQIFWLPRIPLFSQICINSACAGWWIAGFCKLRCWTVWTGQCGTWETTNLWQWCLGGQLRELLEEVLGVERLGGLWESGGLWFRAAWGLSCCLGGMIVFCRELLCAFPPVWAYTTVPTGLLHAQIGYRSNLSF